MDICQLPWDCINTITTCITATIATLLAILTFIKGILEYRKQGSQKRLDLFINMKKRLRENNVFKYFYNLSNKNEIKFSDLSDDDKNDFLDILEEVTVMMNSKLISKELARDMFGNDAITHLNVGAFLNHLNKRGSRYLRDEFLMKMKELGNKERRKIKKSAYRF